LGTGSLRLRSWFPIIPDGGLIRGEADDNTVKFNTVAFNGGFGVWVMGVAAGNLVSQNKIHDNGVLGLAIDEPKVIPNDVLDGDSGANNRQNYPVLTSAVIQGSDTVIQGSLGSAVGTAYTVELYANDACDPSGYGEGQRFIKAVSVTTDVNGLAAINTTSSYVAISTSMFITATATDPNGNTSGFSQCIPVTQAPTPTPAPTSGGMQFKPSVYPSELFYGGCTPDRADISVEVLNPPEEISYLLLFVRLVDQKTGAAGPWSEGLSMSILGKNKFLFSLLATKVPDYDKFDNAWLQYQFVAYNKSQKEIGRSDVYGDVALRKCGGAGITPTKKPGMTG
jgi:hypothetical protein